MDDCPALWQLKLQSETALSIMGAEVIALSHSGRELLPIIDMVTSLGDALELPKDLTTMHVSIHEDNDIWHRLYHLRKALCYQDHLIL